ncbi:MAG: hypothetical protein ABI647_02125 [Gemmatimonadota bacterium]
MAARKTRSGHRTSRRWLAVVAALVIVAPTSRATHPAPLRCDAAEGRTRCLFIERNIGIGQGPLALEQVRKLGTLLKEETQSGGAAPGGGNIAVHRLQFEGLTVEVVVTPAGPVLLRSVALSRPAARLGEKQLPRALVIGRSTITDVEFALGTPKSTDHAARADHVVYTNLEETARVEFEFGPNGRPLRRVTWSYQID